MISNQLTVTKLQAFLRGQRVWLGIAIVFIMAGIALVAQSRISVC